MAAKPAATEAARRREVDRLAAGWSARFLDALRAGSAAAAEAVAAEAVAHGMEAAAVHSHVIEPAMDRIGDLWERGAITVADEHLATAISQGVLARLFATLLKSPLRARERILLAGTQGEHHVLGLRMAADVLEGAGFDVLYLGPDVPGRDLVAACRTYRPAVLALTVAMPNHVFALLRELAQLDTLEHRPAVIVGGLTLDAEIERGLRVTAVAHSEDVVAAVEAALLAEPLAGPLVPVELLGVEPAVEDDVFVAAGQVDTVPEAFSDASVAAAETARAAGRHAYTMEGLAYRDALTGLWNRRAYDDRFHEVVAERSGELSVLMIDVDHFKEINDVHGHAVGDRTLVDVARVVLDSVRPTDFAARFGGDEFVVLLPDTTGEQAVMVAERIRLAVQEQLSNSNLTVSVGTATFRDSLRATARAVDMALYDAKEAGRNRVMSSAAGEPSDWSPG